ETQQAGEHQHVDENIGAEAKERVPVARSPKGRAASVLGCGAHGCPHQLSNRHVFGLAKRPCRACRSPARPLGDVRHDTSPASPGLTMPPIGPTWPIGIDGALRLSLAVETSERSAR